MDERAHQAIEAARALLPAWVEWVNVGLPLLVTFVYSATSIAAGAAVALALRERRPGDHWTEKARAAFPVRRTMGLGAPVVCMVVASLSAFFSGPLSPISQGVMFFFGHLPASVCGAMLVFRQVGRRLGDTPRGRGLGNFAFWVLLMFPQWLVIGVVAGVVSETSSGIGIAAFACGVVALAFLYLGGGLLMLRALGVATPASPRLAAIVHATSERVGIRPRCTYELRTSIANALAIPTSRHLAFTEAALAILDDDEIAAVCAHELGHLAEPWPVLVARCAEPLLIMSALSMSSYASGWDSVLLWGVVAGAFGTYVVMRRLRRRREVRADEVAHAHEPAPGTYARALEKLYEANHAPMVLRGRRHSHPDLYDRMAAAGASLPFERPIPPARLPTIAGVATTATVACLLAIGLIAALEIPLRSRQFDRRQRLWHIAIRGGGAEELAELGYLRWRDDAYDEAIIFRRAAAAIDPFYVRDLIQALLEDGRCDEAESVLTDTRSRRRRRGLTQRELRDFERDIEGCGRAPDRPGGLTSGAGTSPVVVSLRHVRRDLDPPDRHRPHVRHAVHALERPLDLEQR